LNIYRFSVIFVVSCFLLSGCADIEAPKTEQLLKNPLGPGSVKIGMTKSKVISVYGDPDMKNTVWSDEWGGMREEWVYTGIYTALPVNAGYLAKDLYLYFDGENLTNISKEPLGTKEQGKSENVEESIK